MSLRRKALRKKAKNLELKALEDNNINGRGVADLNQMLHVFYVSHCPGKVDYRHRRELVRIFNQIAKEIYGNPDDSPSVECFGSFIMDMFNNKSDLDLSINFSGNAVEISRDKKIKTLWKFAKKLYSLQSQGHVYGIQTIMSARVPIVKVIDRGTGIECDLSVENRDGMTKSQIVHIVSAIDERFKKLSLLVVSAVGTSWACNSDTKNIRPLLQMKAWAKTHDINSSKDRTLNSLSIIALVAFHLQTRDPPILPPFYALFKDGANPAAVMKVVQNYLDYGIRNKESLAELFITLFVKLSSVEKLWCEGLCASLYEGSWISKALDPKLGSINVEDFTDRSQNVARAVGSKGFKKIYKCINHSLSDLLAYLDGRTPLTNLKELLFGMDIVSSTWKGAAANQKHNAELLVNQNSQHNKRKRLAPNEATNAELHGHWNSQQDKRRRPTEGWEVPQHLKKLKGMQPAESGWGGAQLGNDWGGGQLGSGWGGGQLGSGWERNCTVEGWRGKHPAEVQERTELPKHWREPQLAGGGRWQTGNWGGTHLVDRNWIAEGWQGKQSAEVWERTQLPKHWREPQLAEGGKWQTGSRGETHLVERNWIAEGLQGKQSAEVWERTQLPKHWREPQLAEGGRWQTGSRGETHLVERNWIAEGLQGKQSAEVWEGTQLPKHWREPQLAEGGRWQTGSRGGTHLVERNWIAEGWRGKQPAEVWERTQLPKHWRERQLPEGGRWQAATWGGTHLVEGFGVAHQAKGWAEKRPFDGSWL